MGQGVGYFRFLMPPVFFQNLSKSCLTNEGSGSFFLKENVGWAIVPLKNVGGEGQHFFWSPDMKK